MNPRRATLWAVALTATVAGGACKCAKVPAPEIAKILFVKRAPYRAQGLTMQAGQVNEPVTYQPGGNLYLLEPASPDGKLTPLLSTATLGSDVSQIDVMDPTLDWDASRVVFALKLDQDTPFHVYVVGLDGKNLHQLTFGDADDIDPVFLPDGRIYFLSAARGEKDEYERRTSTLGTIVNADGTGREEVDFNLSHERAPTVQSTGKLLYSRWEHHGPVNRFSLFEQSPGRGDAFVYAGRHGGGPQSPNSYLWAHETGDHKVVAAAMPRTGTYDAGALVLIDRTLGEDDNWVNLTPDVPVYGEMGHKCSPAGRYRHPWPLGGDRYLVSWAPGCVSDETARAGETPDFGLYVYDAKAKVNRPVYNDPKAWDLSPIPVLARPVPPVIPPMQPATQNADTFLASALDVYDSGTPFTPLPAGSVKTIRLVEGMSNKVVRAREAGRTEFEPKAILGEVPLFEDGSFIAELPANTAVHVQPLDEFGLSLRNQTTWFFGRPGEARTCGGCHEARTENFPVGVNTEAATAYRADPSQFQRHPPIPQRQEIDFRNDVQPILSKSCATSGCHDARTAAGNYTSMAGQVIGLDLSDTTVGEYTAAYYSLTFEDELATATDLVVKKDIWISPGSARDSKLVERMNVRSRLDPAKWAFPTSPDAPHPEDVGVTLTDGERALIAAWVDLGATFYTRKDDAPQQRVWEKWSFDEGQFEGAIEPYLIQSCATGGCHAYVASRENEQLAFNLVTDPQTAEDHQLNYRAVTDWVNPASPDDSWLLMKPLAGVSSHNGGDLWASAQDPSYQMIRGWIAAAVPK